MPISCAMFGKVPTRRDFVAVNTPRQFLTTWEQWLQNAVASSREALKTNWDQAFLTAPIWRFWLGMDTTGAPTIGALMPSVDGVGRYFPLTIAAFADGDETLAPPEVDAQEPWFEEVERVLLWTLDQHDHSAVLVALRALSLPQSAARSATFEGVIRSPHGVTCIAQESRSFEECLTLTRQADPERSFSSSSFWWTKGGEGYPAMAFASLRLPPIPVFTAMLTGDFKLQRSDHG